MEKWLIYRDRKEQNQIRMKPSKSCGSVSSIEHGGEMWIPQGLCGATPMALVLVVSTTSLLC